MLNNKPFSESCVQNCQPILDIIQPLFANSQSVLEVGSGTGQHAVYFASQLPHLTWHTSDVEANQHGINLWLTEAALSNTRPPIELDVFQEDWPNIQVDSVFSANTAHIMSWAAVKQLIQGVGKLLPKDGTFCLYGPFNYNGSFTSESNARFDQWLKQRDPLSGVRDFEAVNQLAKGAQLVLIEDHPMPANNRILCWRKA